VVLLYDEGDWCPGPFQQLLKPSQRVSHEAKVVEVNVQNGTHGLRTPDGAHSFNKIRKDSTIEVVVNSRFSVGEFTDATGVSFQVRIDDKKTPNFGNQGSLTKANTSEFLSILAVFQKLPPGKHTVSIWGRAAHMGKASGMLVDPGGWGGKIIVKEAD
jgi:hypothetical protein